MQNVMERYQTFRQVVDDITLMNNRFMNKVFDGNIPATQRMLRVILKNDKIKVRKVSVQQWLQNLYGHSAQLDILAEDENGTQFNVEIQRSDEGASVQRARFYCGALDMHFLDKGKKYEALPDAYVIFITESDVFKEGRPIYNVERSINESGKAFGDGSHIVYVNAACQDDTPLGRLMQDFNCNDPAKMHYKELADTVNYFKSTKEGEIDMTDIIEAYAKNKAEEAAHQRNVEVAKDMLADNMSIESVARYSKLSEEEVRALAEKQSA
ncbi:Rpn family recombination-promoting nuclease/putative transposase [uncultured Phascolarctobacterium sp.]|uniref:Rpn family recombination-promoting nuclease/putative transposase n=1 Tax=uncultured Phascolarctobacterium sp. TaxID=512296 RepID=UPI00261F75C5|nr:Rpn family recombination-promoting nuclease/putative transposase [uncultured Phascolarctobacterium sp.]